MQTPENSFSLIQDLFEEVVVVTEDAFPDFFGEPLRFDPAPSIASLLTDEYVFRRRPVAALDVIRSDNRQKNWGATVRLRFQWRYSGLAKVDQRSPSGRSIPTSRP
jgi:hypothetical protein